MFTNVLSKEETNTVEALRRERQKILDYARELTSIFELQIDKDGYGYNNTYEVVLKPPGSRKTFTFSTDGKTTKFVDNWGLWPETLNNLLPVHKKIEREKIRYWKLNTYTFDDKYWEKCVDTLKNLFGYPPEYRQDSACGDHIHISILVNEENARKIVDLIKQHHIKLRIEK